VAYQIIWINYVYNILIDYFFGKTLEVIDCRTFEGQKKYIKLFGKNKFNYMVKRYGVGSDLLKINNQIILSETLTRTLFSNLNERSKRLVAGFLALSLTTRKKVKLARFLSIDTKTLQRGIRELLNRCKLPKSGIRIEGGGRKTKNQEYPQFSAILDKLSEDHLAGDPMSSRKSVRKSLNWFKKALGRRGISVSRSTLRTYLCRKKISLKSNMKSVDHRRHPSREKQFKYISRKIIEFFKADLPIISVDTKKKEQIGLFNRIGRLWRKSFRKVFTYDFPSLGIGKLVPYGIYDLKNNFGYMFCSLSSDTPQFAVEMVVHWWREFGQLLYPDKKELLILCDGGGSNGYRPHGWKIELQKQLAAEFGLTIRICHYPTGCSKFNPIERKLFSFISINWAGEPLDSVEKALSYIESTETETGLQVKAIYIEKAYKKGVKYSKSEINELKIRRSRVLPNWNYTLLPN